MLPVSRLYSFLDHKNGFNIHFLEGQKLIEVYPPSSIDETYNYEYWSVPATLGFSDSLPPEIDEYVLREGVLVDVYRYKSEMAMQKALERIEEPWATSGLYNVKHSPDFDKITHWCLFCEEDAPNHKDDCVWRLAQNALGGSHG